MAGKKIKLEEEAISEILVADTASELGVEASDVESSLRRRRRRRRRRKKKKKKKNNNNNSKP
jgi:hypothetical protein